MAPVSVNDATARPARDMIALVTGANRGIGYEICRQLAGRGARVVLTARNPEAGELAVRNLAAENLPAQFHPLSVTDPAAPSGTCAKAPIPPSGLPSTPRRP